MRVGVKIYKTLNVPTPEYGTPLSAGFDLAPAVAVTIEPKTAVLARTGLIIQAPPNHFIMVVPRSSTYKRWGLRLGNTVGIVDEDYCGPEDEMHLSLFNDTGHDIIIPAGTRLAQGVFVPVTRAIFEVVDEPIAATRGGWGSTGV